MQNDEKLPYPLPLAENQAAFRALEALRSRMLTQAELTALLRAYVMHRLPPVFRVRRLDRQPFRVSGVVQLNRLRFRVHVLVVDGADKESIGRGGAAVLGMLVARGNLSAKRIEHGLTEFTWPTNQEA